MNSLDSRVLVAFSMIALGSLISTPARAALVSVEPDSYSNNTNISTLYPGVTLSTLGSSNSSVYSITNNGLSTTGSKVFGNRDDGVEWGNGFNGGMKAVFAVATNYVQIDIIGNDSYDVGRLIAYNSANQVLFTYTTSGLSTGQFETASITRGAADIAYVIATGSANGNESVSLDNLKYNVNTVPEPSAIAMLGCGAVALFGVHRRCQAKQD